MRCITNAEGVYVNRCVYTTYVCMYIMFAYTNRRAIADWLASWPP